MRRKKVVSNTQEVIKNKDKLNGRFGKQISFRTDKKRPHAVVTAAAGAV